MARISRIGFGQVQPNHLSAPRDGRVYAQLPADDTVFTDGILEQGMFVKYDYATNKVNLSGEGEWMLVYNQEKLYDERKQNHKDYVMRADDFTDGTMVPRVFGTVVGDIMTINTIGKYNPDYSGTFNGFGAQAGKTFRGGSAGEQIVEGSKLTVDPTTGYLHVDSSATDFVWTVAKVYTMADGQPGIKIQRIK